MSNTKTEKIQVLLTPEQKEELLKEVNKTDISLSHYVRRLIVLNLKEKKE